MEIFHECGMQDAKVKLASILTKVAKKSKKETSEFDDMLYEFESVYDDDNVDELLASDVEVEKNRDSNIQMDFEDE